ncbi:pilus assembly protein [Neisseriaceae bacterium TC5R-5]|nr:pilus assembly protein [Neisseriaceae bacterium TC5R-5]
MTPLTPDAYSHKPSALARGFALVASLLFLVLITIIGISMFRSYGLQGRMSGNFREKSRAFESAQAALRYAEWWLSQGNVTTAVNCSSIVSTPVVCSNAHSSPTTLPWTVGVNYTPSGMTIASSGINTYTRNPMFYIQYLGVNAINSGLVYQINAVGYGGNQAAVVVLQSTFIVSSTFNNLGK